MERGSEFLSGEVMAAHWDAGATGVATLAAKKKKPSKPSKKAKPRRRPTKSGPGCDTEPTKPTCSGGCTPPKTP